MEVKKLDSPDLSISKSGLVVSLKHPWLAANPDGLVYDPNFNPSQGLAELKNPYSTRDNTAEETAAEEIAASKSFYLHLDKAGKLYIPQKT